MYVASYTVEIFFDKGISYSYCVSQSIIRLITLIFIIIIICMEHICGYNYEGLCLEFIS